jgi:hypothetical protein
MTNRPTPVISAKSAKLLALLISAVLIVYNILRMLYIPMTHDEAGAVLQLPSYYDLVTLKTVTANNHILNSVLRKFFVEALHNTSPFVLRLDNLLALALFLYAAYKLLQRLFDKPLWLLAGFVFLVLNPYLFEFWGLSRGYGLSIAFMTASICCWIIYLQDKKISKLWLSLFCAILAVYSNFSLLNFYLALAASTLILPFLFDKNDGFKIFAKSLLPLTVSAVLLFLMIATPLKALYDHHELYYGGTIGLRSDTLKSLIDCSFMINYDSQLMRWVNRLIFAYIYLTSAYWILACFRQKDERTRMGTALFLLFILPVIGISLQHYLFGVKYLIDRTALFFVILFKLQLLYTAWHFSQKQLKIARAALLLLACLACANFVRLANIRHTWSWWYDSNNIVVLNRMIDEHKDQPGKIKVRTNWVFAPSFIYYTSTDYNSSFQPIAYIHTPVTVKDTSYHYYYIPANESTILTGDYVRDTSFFGDQFVLMKRKW